MEDGISPKTFEKQMLFLAENKYEVVPLNQALSHLNRKIRLSSRALAITIDGGYHDAFINVLPILKKHNFPATFFVPPEYIEKYRTIKGEPIKCMSWNEIREIRMSNMEIGLLAYGGRSIRLHYDERAIRESILPAITIMNREIDCQVKYCAFKEGVPKKPLWRFLRNQGFEAIFTQCPTNRSVAVDGIGRIQIDDDDHNIFLTKISKTYLFFKDKRSWKYIRKHKLDKAGHWLSEAYEQVKEKKGIDDH